MRIVNENLLNFASKIDNLNEQIATLQRKVLYAMSNKRIQQGGEKISGLAAIKKKLPRNKKRNSTFRVGKN